MFPGNLHHDHDSHSRHRGCGSHLHGLQSHGSGPHCGGNDERDDGHRCGESRHGNGGLGENYGWGREGSVRFNSPHMRPGFGGSPRGGLSDGLSGLRLGSGGGGGGGSLLNGSMDYPRGLHRYGSGSGSLRRNLLDPRRDPYSDPGPNMGSRLSSREPLGPYMTGGRPISSNLRASSGSSAGSLYSLTHFDRRPRQYHHQPPQVEDDIEDIIEEELLRRRRNEMARHGMVDDPYGGVHFENNSPDLRGRRSGF